jgi:DNA-binding helix-hairpin-helix protein with protein kinase domain
MAENTFTKEELTEAINEAVQKATKGMYSEEDFQQKLQSEVDRRVQSGIEKGVNTQLEKWKQEQELTAEELAKKKIEERQADLDNMSKTLAQKENRLNAINQFSEAGIGKDDYDGMLDLLIDADPEVTSKKVNTYIDKITSAKTRLEKSLKEKYSKVPSPTSKSDDDGITKDKFNKMSYSEKIELKTNQPELYKTFVE